MFKKVALMKMRPWFPQTSAFQAATFSLLLSMFPLLPVKVIVTLVSDSVQGSLHEMPALPKNNGKHSS